MQIFFSIFIKIGVFHTQDVGFIVQIRKKYVFMGFLLFWFFILQISE